MTSQRFNAADVAVIGAGPYGLSVSAHLLAAGVSTRVFGEPMSFWSRQMPKGMLLRSPWRATHFSDRGGKFSLDAYASGRTFAKDKPLPIDDFIDYGNWFQTRAVPDIDRRAVRSVDAVQDGFRLTLADGETVAAGRVVMATGLANQEYRPQPLHDLPPALVKHSCEHEDFAPLRGKHVAVIGRGQSACESAALLAEAGADVDIICRGDIRWLGGATRDADAPTSPLERLHDLLEAPSAVGPFPLSWLVELPDLIRRMPAGLRETFSKRCLRAAAAGWLRPRVKDVRCLTGRTILGARAESNRVVLELDNGPQTFDHVVLGTGYRVDIARIGVLSPALLEKIVRVGGSPLLGPGFESSVPKLHFVGSNAVHSFGPLLRFIAGAPYAARAVARAVLAHGTARDEGRFTSELASSVAGAAPGLSPRH